MLRNANSALRAGTLQKIDSPAGSNVYAYLRHDATASFVIVLNFEDKPVSLTLDLAPTSLPDGRYFATDVSLKRTFGLDGLTRKPNLDAATGYVLRLARSDSERTRRLLGTLQIQVIAEICFSAICFVHPYSSCGKGQSCYASHNANRLNLCDKSRSLF